MDSTASVSKGCFAFPTTAKGKKAFANSPLNFSGEPWFNGYTNVWKNIINQLDSVEGGVIETLMLDLINFISSGPNSDTLIPTAAILTGINLPDHGSLFSRLKTRLSGEGVALGVAILSSTDCVSTKHSIERCVAQLMESPLDSEEEVEDEEEDDKLSDLKRSQCTLPNLLKWFENMKNDKPSPSKKKKTSLQHFGEKKLVVILKDFETFNAKVLSIFIQILSGYKSKLPFVLVFGIATTLSAIEQLLPHSSISHLALKSFQAQPSVYFLNNTLNKVFLTPDCPFQLSGKLFKFFTQVFLFYDFSVNRFIQGVKYCVMEHYRVGGKPYGLLCCREDDLKGGVEKLDHDDVERLRRLNSFKQYIDSIKDKQKQTKFLSDDAATKKEILKLMIELRQRIKEIYIALSLLHSLVSQLPQAPLGKQLRELYVVAMSKDVWVTPEYKECRQLLGFLSKDELVEKVKKLIEILEGKVSDLPSLKNIKQELSKYLVTVEDAGIYKVTKSPMKSPVKNIQPIKSRSELRQKVVEFGNKDKSKSPYEQARDDLLNYVMDQMIPSALRPFTHMPLWEVVTLVENESRYRVVPRIRAPIHTALNNPAHYLMCDCCKMTDDDEILPTMPDLCIAYKLHLESGPLINMYDWLQSFNLLVNGGQSEEEEVDIKVQARFTQAVSEMEFLGFVRSSKKKADHVARLTWGGSTT